MKPTIAIMSLLFLATASVQAQPYEPIVIWDRSGVTDSSAYGYKILPLGDQNDDGYADWAIYARGNGGQQRGYMEFFHGDSVLPTEPYYTYYPDTAVYLAGFLALSAGDVNGDSHQDWLVELWRRQLPPNYTVFLFYGGPASDSIPDVELSIPIGSTPHSIGDFNADDYDDLYWNNNNGSARVYYGGSPMDTTVDWFLHQPPPGFVNMTIYAIGDFTGDGASDFMCYNPNNGQVGVFLGGAEPDTLPDYVWTGTMMPTGGVTSLNGDNTDDFLLGLGVHFGRDSLLSTPDYVLNSEYAGFPVSAGDFNGDGYNDLIMYAQTAGTPFGALDLHLGHPWLNPDPVFTIEGNEAPYYLRGIFTAAGLGDVNGDSLGDFAIGVWNETFGPLRGQCVIIAGDTLPVSADDPHPQIPRRLEVQAYPNPFNSETTIRLQTPASMRMIEFSLYNIMGQEVRHVTLPPWVGEYSYRFAAQDLSTGIYLLHVQAGETQATKKLVLLR